MLGKRASPHLRSGNHDMIASLQNAERKKEETDKRREKSNEKGVHMPCPLSSLLSPSFSAESCYQLSNMTYGAYTGETVTL